MAHKTLRMAFLRSVVATAFVLLASMAQATFYGGGFDPPDLSGTHVFDLEGNCVHSGTYELTVNNDGCSASLIHLTVLLDHSFPLDFSSFLPFFGINSILVVNGQLAGVDTDLIGPATVSGEGTYAGDWWIQYYYSPLVTLATFADPVDLFHDCTTRVDPNCVVDTALVVTFFVSDSNGNPIPEPGSLVLIAAALGAGWLARRRAAASN